MAFTLFNILLSPIIFLLLLFVVSSRMKPALLSPTYGLVVLYTGMFLFGPFAYDPNYKGASIRIDISPLDVMVILPAVFWMLCAFLAGVLVFSMVAPSGPTLKRNVREFHPVELTTRRSIYILMFSVGAVGLEIYAEGLSWPMVPAYVLHRHGERESALHGGPSLNVHITPDARPS